MSFDDPKAYVNGARPGTLVMNDCLGTPGGCLVPLALDTARILDSSVG